MQEAGGEEEHGSPSYTVEHTELIEITRLGQIKVSENEGMSPSLTDRDTESFWESGKSKKWIQIDFPEGSDLREISLHLDNMRDAAHSVAKISVSVGPKIDYMSEICEIEIKAKENGWISFPLTGLLNKKARESSDAEKEVVQLSFTNAKDKETVRVRGLKAFSVSSGAPQIKETAENSEAEVVVELASL